MIISKKIKNIVSIIIALLFLYNSFGYLLLYFPIRTIIKHNVFRSIEKKRIAPGDLSVLAFSIIDLNTNEYDFIWKKPGKEFKFNGKMYDIENKEVKGDSVFYTCYYDNKENILEEMFALYSNNTKKDNTQNPAQRVLLVGLYFEQLKYFSFKINSSDSSNLSLNKNEANFLNHTSDVLTPPPRIIV